MTSKTTNARKVCLSLAALTVALLVAMPAKAVTIFQSAAANYLAFEAELGTFGTEFLDDGRGTIAEHRFDIIADGDASGGMAIKANNPGGALSDRTNGATAVYGLVFETAGLYNVYVRHNAVREGGFGTNSAWLSQSLDVDPASGSFRQLDNLDAHENWEWHKRLTFVANDRRGIVGDPIPPEDRLNEPYKFVVLDAELGTSLTFAFKKREALYEIDRVVFTLEPEVNNTVAALDTLGNSSYVVPEPSTALISLCLAALLATSRRNTDACKCRTDSEITESWEKFDIHSAQKTLSRSSLASKLE